MECDLIQENSSATFPTSSLFSIFIRTVKQSDELWSYRRTATCPNLLKLGLLKPEWPPEKGTQQELVIPALKLGKIESEYETSLLRRASCKKGGKFNKD